MMEHIVSCTRATYEESTLQAATDAVVQHTRLFSLNELSCNRLGLGVASDSVWKTEPIREAQIEMGK